MHARVRRHERIVGWQTDLPITARKRDGARIPGGRVAVRVAGSHGDADGRAGYAAGWGTDNELTGLARENGDARLRRSIAGVSDIRHRDRLRARRLQSNA